MKRILVIGDIHGRNNWKLIRDRKDIDLFIFLGDYTDSFNLSNIEILHNLNEIIEFKKELGDKVCLLLGNHDIQYIFDNYNFSGYRNAMRPDLYWLFTQNKDLFKIAHKEKDYLFTHAGICIKWFEQYCNILVNYGLNDDLSNVDIVLEDIYNSRYNYILHQIGYKRGGMRGDFGGPTFCDKGELITYPLELFNQVVGHTHVKNIEIIKTKSDKTLYFCDCLGKDNIDINKDFLILDI